MDERGEGKRDFFRGEGGICPPSSILEIFSKRNLVLATVQ